MMKKSTKLLSVLLALCMVASLLPGMALAASKTVSTASELTNAIDQAAAGDTITINANITLTNTLTIDKAITLNGGGKTITCAKAAAITVTTGTKDKPVTLTNLVVTGAETGINITGSAYVKMTGSIDLARCTVKGINVANTATLDLTNATLSFVGEGKDSVPVLARDAKDGDKEAVIKQSTNQPLYNVGNNFFLTGDAKLTRTTAGKTTTVGYHDLDSALENAEAGDTITLERSISDRSAALTISESLTFDLGGKELSFTGDAGLKIEKGSAPDAPDVTVTLQNGTIKAAKTAVALKNATVNLASSAILKGGAASNPVLVVGENSTANISGDISTEVASGVAVSDKEGMTSTITIKSGADILAKGANTVGVKILGNCTLSIEAGTFTGATALSVGGGNATITTGSFTGGSDTGTGIAVTGGTVKLGGGVYSGSTAISAAKDTTTIAKGCCFNGAVTLADKLATLGCYFTVAPASSMLADKVIAGASDKAGYTFMTKAASVDYAKVGDLKFTKPDTSTSVPQKAANSVKITDAGKQPFFAAANDVAAKVTDTQATLKKALTDATVTVGENDTFKVVIQPALTIETGTYSSTNGTLSFKVTATYDKIATKSTVENGSIALTGSSKNAVALASAQTLGLSGSSTAEYSLTIPSGIATKTSTGSSTYKDMQVKHLAPDGSTYTYVAKVSSELTATFTSTHGAAGTFTIEKADSRKLIVKFDKDSSGKAVTTTVNYTAADIGNALPTFTGCDGWKFTTTADGDITGVKDTYTKLTGTVWDTLMKNVAAGGSVTVKATAVLAKDTAFDVTIKSSVNGTVTANMTKDIKKGTTVTLTVVPASDYKVGSLIISGASGYALNYATITANSKYTFAMPEEDVTVTATFTTTFPFTDVIKSDWYYDEVKYAYDHGLVSGLDADTFAPESNTTRGMVVTLLYRLSGKPSIANENVFTDVPNGMYYTTPIIWANYNEIVTGYGNGKFAPDEYITREQMATILYKYAKFRGVSVTATADLSKYPDSSKVQSYAAQAMSWAVAKGLINGIGGSLVPQGTATRAQVAAILARFDQNII